MITVRIELHRETNYTPLHTQMAVHGFIQYVKGDNGRLYRLPTGMYYCNMQMSAQQALNEAKKATLEVGHANAAVFVSEGKTLMWSGLEEASSFEYSLFAKLAS